MATLPRRSKLEISRVGRTKKTIISTDYPELRELLNRRDPETMGALLSALNKSRTLFSWLTPETKVIGVPSWADKDLPWLTLVDDLGSGAAGLPSFDADSLKWWATRAGPIAIDAATPTPSLYVMLGSMAADGYLVLIIQTVESRRRLWHQYFVSIRVPTARTLMMHRMKDPQPGGPKHILKIGDLHADFERDVPILSPDDLKSGRPGVLDTAMAMNCSRSRGHG
jgi:hypothetical protein